MRALLLGWMLIACGGKDEAPAPTPGTSEPTAELALAGAPTKQLATEADLAAATPGLFVEATPPELADGIRAAFERVGAGKDGAIRVRVRAEPGVPEAPITGEVEATWLVMPHVVRMKSAISGRTRTSSAGADVLGRLVGQNLVTELGKHKPRFAQPASHAKPVTAVAVGERLACTLHADKQVACWGAPTSADAIYGPVPVRIPVYDARELRVGREHACARHGAGGLSCWGVFGDDRRGESRVIANVCGIQDATALAVGDSLACAIVGGGKVACFPIAPGALEPTCTPVTVTGLAGATAIAAHRDVICALAPGGPRCWSRCDATGCAAERNVPPRCTRSGRALACGSTPAPPKGAPALVEVSGTDARACGRTEDGELWCWAGAAAPTKRTVY